MQHFLPKAFLLLALSCTTLFLHAQTGCPGCMIDLPTLPEDTILVQQIPDGKLNVSYTEDISFRMPISTDPVVVIDPSAPPGINIDNISIVSVTNLPAGISWEPNQTEFNVSDGETDGCIRFCGTPLQTGLFMVEFTISAQVAILNQEASFFLEFYVAPATSNTVGFSMANNVGCGSAMVSFENNVPSNGNPGYSYFWDFGNGFTTSDEIPADQVYDEPGTYLVEYEATIDTIGTILASVEILASGCNDVLSAPDYIIELYNPSGAVIFTSDEVSNTNPPVLFNLNIPIGAGNYSVKVIDDEGLLGQSDCGTIPFNQQSSGVLSIGDLEIELTIINPISTIQSTDTVFVYPFPDAPEVSFELGNNFICLGDSAILVSSYPGTGNQWFFNGELIPGATEEWLTVHDQGTYTVEFTAPLGCATVSDVVDITNLDPPPTPAFFIFGNLMTLDPAVQLPSLYTLQWYLDGVAISDANESALCAFESGQYTLELTNLETGCKNTFNKNVIYNPSVACSTNTQDQAVSIYAKVFPNPVSDKLIVSTTPGLFIDQLNVYDYSGKPILFPNMPSKQSTVELQMNALPTGIYLIEILTEKGRLVKKVVKK